MTYAVEFNDVSRRYGEVRAVDRVTMGIRDGEFFSMLGPSGSGKTTCLRLIAGFEQLSGGAITLFGKEASELPPWERDVNTVFQDYALFPHMSILDNVAYGLMVKGIDKKTRHARAQEALEKVSLGFNVGGKVYGTPYQWGPNLLMYNTKTFPTPPDSWSVIFVKQNLPDGKTNQGRVQAYDGPIYIADAALFVKATQPDLGITDPYQLTEAQYAAVLKVLRDQHALIHRYWHDTTVQMSDFKNEGVVASSAWPYQANALKADNQPVATVFPKEGVTGWADTTMLHSDAKHPVCAYKWMNWSLTPKVQGDLAAWFGSLPVVAEGCKASTLLGEKGCETNGYTYFDKIMFWKTPIAQGGKFVPYSRWTQDYIAIMGGR